MAKTFTFLCLAALIMTVFTIESSTVSGVSIRNEQDLANYLKVLLGENHENINEDLKKFVAENKLSVMNAAEQVAVIVKNDDDSDKTDQSFEITPEFMKKLGQSFSKIVFHDMSDKGEEEIKEFKENNMKRNCKHHQMMATKGEMAKISAMIKQHNKRILQATQASDDLSASYITKFFFGLLFFLVTIGLFFAIACMQNKKDSLLYAKFIADVGR